MTSIVSERGRRIRPRRLVTFLLIAYGGAWLIELPLWLGNGLRTPHAKIYLALMMLAPAAAALVTVKLWPDGRKLVDVLGLRPTRPFRRWWWTMLVAWFGPAVLVALAVGISYAFGKFPVDWGTWSVLRASLGGRQLPLSMSTLLAIALVQGVVEAPVLNMVFTVGEELGWRGLLRDELSVLPRWQLIGITGVVWGLWHAPVVLLGYDYAGMPPAVGLLCMVVFTTLTAALLEWLRTKGTSIWPTTLAHGAINGVSSLVLILAPVVHPPAVMWSGLLGWSGWLVMAIAIGVLVLTGGLRLRAVPAEEELADRISPPRSGPEPDRVGGADPSPDRGASGARS